MLPPLLFAIREVPQASTSCAPFELVYRHRPRGLLNIVSEEWRKAEAVEKRVPRQVVELSEKLDCARRIARDHLEESQTRQKQYYDQSVRDQKFQVGE